MSNNAVKSSMRHLSMLGAWALAFGCAVGSDAFVMPWNDFLPKAGPLGTVLGIFIGSLIMISLGIIGYYIARIYDEIKGRPRYIIEEYRG